MTTFNQLFESALYETVAQTGDAGWCGYIYNPNAGGTPPQSGATLASLFSSAFPYGIFVFSHAAPEVTDEASANAFVNSVVNYLSDTFTSGSAFRYYAMIWLSDTETISGSTAHAMTLSFTSFLGVVSPLSYNPSCDVELAIQSGTPSTLNGDLIQFQTFTWPGSPTMYLNSQFDSVYRNALQNIYVPTNGPLMGCLVFNAGISSGNDNFPANNAALSYFCPEQGQPGAMNRFSYPLFDSSQTQNIGAYYVSLDPNNPLNADDLLRTFFVPCQSFSTPAVLPSGFSTDSGLQIGLAPVLSGSAYPNTTLLWMPDTNAGMIVYANNQSQSGISYDLLPRGQYSMSLWDQATPAVGTTLNLLCGLSGIETFSFQPGTAAYSGDILTFVPGQAACASAYVPPSDGKAQSGAAQLDSTKTTSWVAISNGSGGTAGNEYYSQPTGASLYAAGYGVNKTASELLGFFEPVACTLESGAAIVPVPMTPYRLLQPDTSAEAGDYSDFELKVLSTNRKSVLEPVTQAMALKARQARAGRAAALSEEPQTDATVYSTSPQGLLVQVDKTTNSWDELVLASNLNINTGKVMTMQFTDLNATLQSAFQTNQQFLVMSWNKPMAGGGNVLGSFANEMVIEGWPFIANVPTSDPNGVFTNVMIYKFCEGTLMDRVNDTSTWTSAETFNSTANGNLALLQAWVTDYCETAIAKYEAGDMNYYYFSTIVRDPNWNGILLLECDISVQDFPPELQGLLAGIDLSRFFGHHMGINVNHIAAGTDNQLSMSAQSSLFGLIDYTDPLFDQYGDNVDTYLANVSAPTGDYNYKVLSLKVLFGNSTIVNFNSYVQLAINKLFGCTVQAENNANLIIFTGSYENQNGDPNYIFNETGDNLLPLSSNVLNGIEIVKANFVTVEPQDGTTSTMVNVRFSFWGFMNFAQQSFDLYSFGSEQNDGKNQFLPGDGLSYANMAIDMSFALETSSVQTFVFDVSQMSFDLGQSDWRSASLYGHFPLQLTGILTGDASSQPSSQGYIPLPIPGMAGGSTWAGTWYGLVFNLNMGTMGDLANSLGFNSTMLMVWTAGATGQMGAMIHLPGLSTQAKTLSLQGVLGLNIGNLQLQAAQNQDGGNPVAYMMSLNQITLKFLSFSFPPSGAVNFYLFGDPDANAQPSSLGWYLGYQAPSTSGSTNSGSKTT